MPENHRFMEMPAKAMSSIHEVGLARLYLEICSDGFVSRELGLNSVGEVIHVAPTRLSPYCLSGGRRLEYEIVDDEAVRSLFDHLWPRDLEGVFGQ